MNNSASFKGTAVKRLCILAMLTSITAVLSIYCTFRIGGTIKIPFKFISVFITGTLLGPLCGGAAAGVGDILNLIFAPSGQWLPLITVVEFLNGAAYGLFFYNRPLSGKSYVFRVILCVTILFALDMLITSAILYSAGYFPSYAVAVGARLVAGVIKALIQAAFLLTSACYLETLRNLLRN